MTNIFAIMTEATCGEACWEAREDICKCSCGGVNHGCLRTPDGIKPVRTSKIDGRRYELKSIGSYGDILDEAEAINKSYPPKPSPFSDGRYSYHYKETDVGAPARVRPASMVQIQNWEELKLYKDMDRLELYRNKPYLLWVKVD